MNVCVLDDLNSIVDTYVSNVTVVVAVVVDVTVKSRTSNEAQSEQVVKYPSSYRQNLLQVAKHHQRQ